VADHVRPVEGEQLTSAAVIVRRRTGPHTSDRIDRCVDDRAYTMQFLSDGALDLTGDLGIPVMAALSRCTGPEEPPPSSQ
jgi:hypothetical protein